MKWTNFFIIIKVLLLGIFSVHIPGYKNDLNCSFNQFTWVMTHPVRDIKGSDLLGFDSTAVKNRIKGKNTAIDDRSIFRREISELCTE